MEIYALFEKNHPENLHFETCILQESATHRIAGVDFDGTYERAAFLGVGGELMFTPRPEVDRNPGSGPAIESCPVS